MSRFVFALAAVVASLIAYTSAEVIVEDSAGNTISLPTTGGNATNYITVANPLTSTSPYYLFVSVNDGMGPNGPISNTEIESFYFNHDGAGSQPSASMKFGDGTLVQQQYSASYTKMSGVAGDYVVNASHANAAAGTYTFKFTIPVQSTLTFNLTYVQSGSPNPLPIAELITITIFNPGKIVGDPQFVGLRGQSYQVHGIDGAVYNIISEPSTQVNSRFTFLTEGQCPMIAGKPDTNCWSHPGSYLGEMSFQAIVEDKVHAALIEAGSAQKGFAGVQVDGKALSVGDLVSFGVFSVEFVSTHLVAVTTENYSFQLSNSDMFINQALRATTPLSKLRSHGLLGQTHSVKTYATPLKYIDGDVDDYVIQDGNIFGTDFLFNQFSL